MPVYDLRCPGCEKEWQDVVRPPAEFGRCEACGEALRMIPGPFVADAWGAPRHVRSFDRTFDSKSEMRSHLKAGGWEPAGDRVGGARAETHYKASATSYGGQTRRSTPKGAF